MTDRRRVVITGIGAVAPIGVTRESFWQAALAGTNGVRALDYWELPGDKKFYGGQIDPTELPEDAFDAKLWLRLSLPGRLALVAAREAMSDAAAEPGRIDPWRFGVCMGSGTGNPRQTGAAAIVWKEQGLAHLPLRNLAKLPPTSITAPLAEEFDLRGPNQVFSTSCMAGNNAIARAANTIAAGQADAMLTGGADAMSWVMSSGFGKLTNLRGQAMECSRPFSANRRGVIVGEGAGVLVLESLEGARLRGASIYAEILGSGFACDSYHMSTPHPDGVGGIAAVRQSLARADVEPSAIDYVSAHGTGSQANDIVETRILKDVFGASAQRIPISSIKSMIGHSLGAASALEAIVCALAIRDGWIPPTINYDEPDPDCDLDWVPNRAREHRVATALSTAYAFGGACSALVLGGVGGGRSPRAQEVAA